MAAPTPLPTYIYKIFPASPELPDPLPLILPVSDLDSRDGFMHFSTAAQLLGTLGRFFAKEDHVWILRVPYERVENFITWENGKGEPASAIGQSWDYRVERGYFPHVRSNGPDGVLKLGKDEVDGVKKWKKGEALWEPSGWPYEEDVPKA